MMAVARLFTRIASGSGLATNRGQTTASWTRLHLKDSYFESPVSRIHPPASKAIAVGGPRFRRPYLLSQARIEGIGDRAVQTRPALD